ncbi:hypothetical protein ACIBI4_27645 [Streptomyces sp. NPDC050418]|uniref:hypothetical protein n=1 Tax=Streptomyces sp. NPDC050418 TaxID=3365612 RepID=UPI0037BA7618
MSAGVAQWWGRADLDGRPSRRLLLTGATAGLLATGLVAASVAAGLLTGHRGLGSGAATVLVVGTALSLLTMRAGHAFVLAAVGLGLALSWLGSSAGAQLVLVVRGEQRTVEITEVHVKHYESRNYSSYSCSVALLDGTPVQARAGCDATTQVGDLTPMVFDAAGVVEPTDQPLPRSPADPLVSVVGLTSAFAAAVCAAVVSARPWDPRRTRTTPRWANTPDPAAWARSAPPAPGSARRARPPEQSRPDD